jgi:hypothetical protein
LDSLKILKEGYPVFGEFIGTVLSALVEPAFDSLRQLAVEHLWHVKIQSPERSLDALANKEAEEVANLAVFDWVPYTSEWQEGVESELPRLRAGVKEERAKLVEVISQAIVEGRHEMVARLKSKRDFLEAASSDSPNTDDLRDIRNLASEITQALGLLEPLANAWPISEPGAEQKMKLREAVLQIRRLVFNLERHSLPETPFEAFTAIAKDSDEVIISHFRKLDTSFLRNKFPAQYDKYESMWSRREEQRRRQEKTLEALKRFREIERDHNMEFRNGMHGK